MIDTPLPAVQTECGVGSMAVSGATGGDDNEPLQCERDGSEGLSVEFINVRF